MQRDQPDLGVWVGLLRKRFRLLLATSALAGVITLGLVLLLPRWYQARASVLPPHEKFEAPRNLGNLSSALQAEWLLPFPSGVTLGDVYLAILVSDTVKRRLIERFDLQNYYGISTMAKTLKALGNHSVITPTAEGLIEIKVEDKDPELATQLTAAYIEELDRVFSETRSSAGRRQRVFLELRLAQTLAELDSLDQVLAGIQIAGGIASLSSGLQETAIAAGELLGRRMSVSVQLEMFRESGLESTPAARQLQLELDALDTETRKLPALGLEMAGTIRDIRIREVLYGELSQHLEVARIEEARDTPRVEVLDRPLRPDRHLRPRRGLVSVAGALAGFGLTFLWVAYRKERPE